MTAQQQGDSSAPSLRTQHTILLNKVAVENAALSVALVFFPAEGVDGEVYTPLLHTIQVSILPLNH